MRGQADFLRSRLNRAQASLRAGGVGYRGPIGEELEAEEGVGEDEDEADELGEGEGGESTDRGEGE